jgi:hypothetical protein
MKTDFADAKGSDHGPPLSRAASSPLRLIILLSVLVVVAGALLYDRLIATPAVKATNDRLHDEVLRHNELGLKPNTLQAGGKDAAGPASGETGGALYSDDIQKIIGMAPTRVEKTELYTIEHYRWWGWIPLNRNFITVLYIGDPKKPHYSTHYANEMPEDEVVPGRVKNEPPVVDLTSDASPANAAGAGGASGAGPAAGGMMPPGMKGASGEAGSKEKGRPQGKGDKKGSEAKGNEEGAKSAEAKETKKSEEPKNSEEPKQSEPSKAEASKPEATGEVEKKEGSPESK